MKNKIFAIFWLIFLLFFIYWNSFAFLSDKQKGLIMEKFQKKQQEFIFKDELGEIDNLDALDLFRANSKLNIYNNVIKNVSSKRKKLELENEENLKKIDDLQYQIKKIDEDILKLSNEIKKINSEIVTKTLDIKEKQAEIKELQEKIDKNTQILRKFIVYVYKKWNLFVDKNGAFDNLKAILLSGDNLEKVFNDIYYKEVLAVAWKELLKKHRKLMVKMYIEKKSLETDNIRLKILRKTLIKKKNSIEIKKKFKQKILEVSKWKDALYKKYIAQKKKIEKSLMMKAFAQRIKFYETSKKLLWKQGCKFVDVSKNTPETRLLSKKCYTLNKIIYLEAKLAEDDLKNKKKSSVNIFSWPILPLKWISAYFKDPNYKKKFWVEHNAIDIVADQWTDIKAPKDWYVIAIKKPEDESYAYIALKHSNWFVTVYGHINKALVDKYDYVKAWEVFAKSGWEFGTLWAWYMTTGPHLHFEVLKDKQYVDPLDYLNLSYLKYDLVPDNKKLKYEIDYFERTGKEFKTKKDFNGKVFTIKWDTEIERQKYLLKTYARSDFADWNMWVEEALRWNIDPSFMMCIWLAETGLWRHLKTSYNVWNVWNVDSWGTWTMQNPRQGIWWIWHTLNNKYLRKYNEIRQLSWYWRKGNAPIYASDPVNWHRNVTKCLSALKRQYIPDDYNFRIY